MFQKIVFELTEHFCPCEYKDGDNTPWSWGFNLNHSTFSVSSIYLKCNTCSKQFIVPANKMVASIYLIDNNDSNLPSFGNKL